MNPLGRSAMFVSVGTVAAAVHWSVAVAAVEQAGFSPPHANVVGWLVALVVSFTGHRHLTFGDRRAPALRSALRFFVVSSCAFAINATAYAWLLHVAWMRYDIALALVLLAVALLTYLASRYWAFRAR